MKTEEYRGGTPATSTNKKVRNYIAIFGTLPNELVSAKSSLAIEFKQLCVLAKMNLRQEIIVPDFVIDFRGSKMKNAIQNETERYALKFREQSEFD